MRLEDARWIAEEVVLELNPYCERIEIAGSIRRREPQVDDIEIVYQSQMAPVPGQLLEVQEYPLTDDVIQDLVNAGMLRFDEQVRRNGPRYKRLVHVASGAVVELFRATTENWGLILALRTGPADYNKLLVAHGWDGGVLPVDVKIRDGCVWYRGVVRPVPDEESFFNVIGVPHWPPEHRHPGRLSLWMKAQATLATFE